MNTMIFKVQKKRRETYLDTACAAVHVGDLTTADRARHSVAPFRRERGRRDQGAVVTKSVL